MIKGMTGFGSAQFIVGQLKGVVEVKSVNHRYLDISCYLPVGFSFAESKIQQIIRQFVKRGKVIVSVRIVNKEPQKACFNKEVVKKYLQYSRLLKKEFGVKGDLSLSDIIRLPGVVDAKENLLETKKIWPFLEKEIKTSLQGLINMRKAEGRSLERDIIDKLKRMRVQIRKINARLKTILTKKQKELSCEEFVVFQKNNDIHEEISRLSHYVEGANTLLKENLALGKRLDFIAQEMHRETNTIGSKFQYNQVIDGVIALKSKIEKIREQCQNVE